MSTKETLPDEDAKELRKWMSSFPWFAGVALRIELRNKEITSLRDRLDAAEKELAESKNPPVQEKRLCGRFGLKSYLDLENDISNLGTQLVESRIGLTKAQQANAELVKDRERLEGLLNLTDNEGPAGWRVTLSYDNYQDGALVINVSGKVIAECYDMDLEPNEQFRKAIDAAMKGTQ